MTTLKAGKIFKMTLDDNGTAVSGEPEELFRWRIVTATLP